MTARIRVLVASMMVTCLFKSGQAEESTTQRYRKVVALADLNRQSWTPERAISADGKLFKNRLQRFDPVLLNYGYSPGTEWHPDNNILVDFKEYSQNMVPVPLPYWPKPMPQFYSKPLSQFQFKPLSQFQSQLPSQLQPNSQMLNGVGTERILEKNVPNVRTPLLYGSAGEAGLTKDNYNDFSSLSFRSDVSSASRQKSFPPMGTNDGCFGTCRSRCGPWYSNCNSMCRENCSSRRNCLDRMGTYNFGKPVYCDYWPPFYYSARSPNNQIATANINDFSNGGNRDETLDNSINSASSSSDLLSGVTSGY